MGQDVRRAEGCGEAFSGGGGERSGISSCGTEKGIAGVVVGTEGRVGSILRIFGMFAG